MYPAHLLHISKLKNDFLRHTARRADFASEGTKIRTTKGQKGRIEKKATKKGKKRLKVFGFLHYFAYFCPK